MADEFQERVKLSLLLIAEAVADTANHAGYSGARRLPDEIEKVLDGTTPLPQPGEAPAEKDDEVDDDGE